MVDGVGATYPYEKTTPHALKVRFGKDGLKGFKGSHGIQVGYLKSLEERWSALPSHARTTDMNFPKWKQNFIRQNRQFYENNKAWIAPWLPKILKFPSSLQKLEWNIKGGAQHLELCHPVPSFWCESETPYNGSESDCDDGYAGSYHRLGKAVYDAK